MDCATAAPILETWWDDTYKSGATGEGGAYQGKSYWISTYDWSNAIPTPIPVTYPYDESLYDIVFSTGFATGSSLTFAIIGFDGTNKIVYWDSMKYADGDLEGADDFRTALNKAINEFPIEGVYLNAAIPTKIYDIGTSEDIDVSNIFGEYDANPITITLEGNTNSSAVSAYLDGNTLTIDAIGHSDSYTTITLKGESSVNSLTTSFDIYTHDATSFKKLVQDFEIDYFPPPFWELKYNTATDGGLNGTNLIDPTTSDTWLNNGSSTANLGSDFIFSGESSAAIVYWSPEFNWLISPEMQLDYNDYFLNFWLWFDSDPYASKFHVLVDDGTKGWTPLLSYDGTTPDNNYDSEISLDLSSFHNKTIRIAFVHEANNGENVAIDDITITSTTGISDNGQFTVDNLQLEQNYPNPFNPSTMINFSVEKRSNVSLSIYNQNGQLVNTLVDGVRKSGNHSVNFKAIGLSAGIYYYALTTGENTITKKMILIK